MGPGVECKDETSIFQALGLEYVPPHLRWFPRVAMSRVRSALPRVRSQP